MEETVVFKQLADVTGKGMLFVYAKSKLCQKVSFVIIPHLYNEAGFVTEEFLNRIFALILRESKFTIF